MVGYIPYFCNLCYYVVVYVGKFNFHHLLTTKKPNVHLPSRPQMKSISVHSSQTSYDFITGRYKKFT
jgi:hypothetical protein